MIIQQQEVLPPAKASKARWLVLVPLVPLLVALGFVATLPLQAADADSASAASTVIEPAPTTTPAPAEQTSLPAITAEAPDDSDTAANAAAEAALFPVPAIAIKPPPPPKITYSGSGGSSSSGGGGSSSNPCSFSNIGATSVSSAPYSSAEQGNYALVNAARADAGQAALSWSASHANKARAWAVHLAKNNCPLAHSPSSHWDNGENAYYISGGSLGQLASRAHNGFMGSPGHKANILRSWFSKVGIGVAKSPSGGWYLIQNFGA